MKNNDEFRRLVFEKAEAYEKRRCARNRKITGSVISFALILALTLPISLQLYHQNAQPTEETTASETAAFTTTVAETTVEDTIYTSTTARAETTSIETLLTTTDATLDVMTTTCEETTTAMPDETTSAVITTKMTTTWVPDLTWTTTKPELPSTTTFEETAKPMHLLGDHRIAGFCRYDLFIEYYHGERVLAEVITSEDDLLTYLEAHTELYGGKIMDVLNVYDVNFFREHDLLIIESPHNIRDITIQDSKLIVRLYDGMSNGSDLNFITMEKNGTFAIDSIWY